MAKIGRPKTWTEEKAINLGHDLLDWFKANEDRIFVKEFGVERGYRSSRLTQLKEEFPAFAKLYARAMEIQETRLLKGGVHRILDPGFTKFVMVNHHGYVSEHSKVDATNRNVNSEVEPTEEEWKEFWDEQRKAGTGLDEDSLAE